MPDNTDPTISSLPEEITVPRQNGELLFEAPWEARAFGMAVALHEQGAFEWKAFSEALASEIETAEREKEDSGYYERWLRALRRVTSGEALLKADEISTRAEQVAEEDDHAHEH